ncbi:nucleoside hydrolase [Alteraurantiacibacter buctensis]|uniref:Nucleoside hydrolase n=1 Tax=Alteraurantiacibacter buctensis TaxID=1503981 RepID=A0A844YXM1_9SPHN|nr:nucleoside hydrolase [Alteraurantiacibacter buctensis]MXO71922.1 nucleoside hydrolase [Alteraurantiacibacter buctensis]
MNRRQWLAGCMATASLLVMPAAAWAQARIPQRPGARVIVDNDFAGDPDGIVALTHQVLAPRTIVPLVTVSGLVDRPGGHGLAGRSVSAGERLAGETLRRAGLSTVPPIAGGYELGQQSAGPSPAAIAIITEARRDDARPLFVSCGGPLSNVAEALRLAPDIADRLTVIWIGGGGYPDGGWEYNLSADLAAARHVIEESRVPMWQVPQPAYRLMQASVAEMEADMRPISPFSEWLYERFTSPPAFVELGGSWPMGDSPPVLLTAITGESSRYRDLPARRIGADFSYGEEIPGRTVRVFDELDMRLTWADFLARLRIHAAR